MKTELKWTKDYSRFVFSPENRKINEAHVRDLVGSMSKFGFVPAYPIHVRSTGRGTLEVQDGQHRLEAAKRLCIELYYVACDSDFDSMETNGSVKKWNLEDFLHAQLVKSEKSSYRVIEYACKKHHIPISSALRIFDKNGELSSACIKKFKSGDYLIESEDIMRGQGFIDALSKIREHYTQAYHNRFIKALHFCMKTTAFKIDKFIKKCQSHRSLLRPCADTMDYISMIEQIYNYHCKANEKISLRFEAGKAF